MFLVKVVLWRTSIERPNFTFSATCRYPRGWPLRRSSTVIPKASFFFNNGAVVCLSKNEGKEGACYLLFGSYARSLFGGPVNVRNSEENVTYLHTKQRPPWLHVSVFNHFNEPLTISQHCGAHTNNPHILVIQRRLSVRFESVLFLFQAEGVVMAERLERWICNPEDSSSSPTLTASLSSFFSGGSD